MIPFLGVIPSGVAAVYSAARTIDRLAVVCLYSVRTLTKENAEHYYTALV